MNSTAIRYPLTVFYDASCPMCAGEMQALMNLDRERLELVDCSAPDFDETVLAGVGITRADLMARIHVRDAHGRWLVALDAIEAAYRAVGLERSAEFRGSRLGMNALIRRLIPAAGRLAHKARSPKI